MRTTNFLKTYKYRFVFLVLLTLVSMLVLVGRLANIQLTQGKHYAELSDQRIGKSITLAAPRGEILDRFGRPLVSNRTSFEIVLHKTGLSSEKLNTVIITTLSLVDKSTVAYTDSLPVTGKPYQFVGSADEKEQEKITAKLMKLKKALKLAADASAEAVMEKLTAKYKISGFTDAETRTLCGLRYEMESRAFSVKNPFALASDVDIATVTKVKERSMLLTGVEVETRAIREYASGTLAAHILGTTGRIYEEEAEEYLAKGYSLNEIVGKEGIEKTMEEYLRGTPGTQYVEVTSSGQVIDSKTTEEAKPGNNVYLTIDKRLQEVAESSLEGKIKELAARGKVTGSGADCASGSVVVIDVNTGELLAMASYPTFDLNKFYTDYNTYLANKDKPLFNRAISGTYAPGSTFKMATAIAALESGKIEPDTVITCKGIYDVYAPQLFKCWIYSDYGGTHGTETVQEAIRDSCNFFFYECGRRMGIDTLARWMKKLGLGVKTGIELSGEAAGVVASPEYREKFGRPWYKGDTLQAAIGQSDNLFTPLQLASYVGTIVNGGTRYQAHLIKSVQSFDDSETVLEKEPYSMGKVGLSTEAYQAVMNGMRSVTEDGTASNVFGKYKIAVGGKTGTASVPKGTANGVFVAFAPFDKPEIAIAIVVEHGAHGNSVAPIAKDIFDAYFMGRDANNDAEHENQLLG